MNSNGITITTARRDLDDLVRRRFMTVTRKGREAVYILLPALASKLGASKAKLAAAAIRPSK